MIGSRATTPLSSLPQFKPSAAALPILPSRFSHEPVSHSYRKSPSPERYSHSPEHTRSSPLPPIQPEMTRHLFGAPENLSQLPVYPSWSQETEEQRVMRQRFYSPPRTQSPEVVPIPSPPSSPSQDAPKNDHSQVQEKNSKAFEQVHSSYLPSLSFRPNTTVSVKRTKRHSQDKRPNTTQTKNIPVLNKNKSSSTSSLIILGKQAVHGISIV